MNVLIIIKPDAFERKLVGYCIAAVEAQGTILDCYLATATKYQWEDHYADHKGKDFFDNLIAHMMSGPVIAIRADVRTIEGMRTSMAQTRRMMRCDGPANLMHCSDSPDSAGRELHLWFG